MMATWFSANLFFESVHELTPSPPALWEEVMILVSANDEATARQRADAIGREKEHEYFVDDPVRHVLRWRFVKVERIYEIDSPFPKDGADIFSRFLRGEEARSLLTPFDE